MIVHLLSRKNARSINAFGTVHTSKLLPEPEFKCVSMTYSLNNQNLPGNLQQQRPDLLTRCKLFGDYFICVMSRILHLKRVHNREDEECLWKRCRPQMLLLKDVAWATNIYEYDQQSEQSDFLAICNCALHYWWNGWPKIDMKMQQEHNRHCCHIADYAATFCKSSGK